MKTTFRYFQISLLSIGLQAMFATKVGAQEHILEAAALNGKLYFRWEPEVPFNWTEISRVRILVTNTKSGALRKAAGSILERVERECVLELGIDGENWYPVSTGSHQENLRVLTEFGKGSTTSRFGRIGRIDLPLDENAWKTALNMHDTLIVRAPKDFPSEQFISYIRDMLKAGKIYTTQAAEE